MSVLNSIRENFSPEPDRLDSGSEKISAAQPPQEKISGDDAEPASPVPCRDTPACTVWWYDHGDPSTGTPSRLRCGTCDPPPAKTREHVRGVLRLPGADGYEPPLPDREFFSLPCGLPEWGCNCGRSECALGRAERKAKKDDQAWVESTNRK